ncbi:hypothetical protein [Paraglaciecola sp.]|uniref:hypothetical protein n=1 Tax=Paraglaciecola sp. TaxID=1920173 RepID=UPI00273D7870|nr:hypothetical protein [Paraglaciecola sp.]MDP5033208.1 hypothetical protein [Paraglaciecola sp.]
MFDKMEVKISSKKVNEIGIHPLAEPAFVCFLNIAELRESFKFGVQLEAENPFSLPMPFVVKHNKQYMSISHFKIMAKAYISAPNSARLNVLKVRNLSETQIKILSWIYLIDIYESTPIDEMIDAIFKHSLRHYPDDFIMFLLGHRPKSRLINRLLNSRFSPESWVDFPYPLPLRF